MDILEVLEEAKKLQRERKVNVNVYFIAVDGSYEVNIVSPVNGDVWWTNHSHDLATALQNAIQYYLDNQGKPRAQGTALRSAQLEIENARLREALDLTQAKVARLQKAMLDVMYFAGDDYNDGVELTPGAKHALNRVKETALEAVRASK